MDAHITAVRSHLKLANAVLEERLRALETTRTRLSRHYSTVAHTRAMLTLVEELRGLAEQDPDMWDAEPDIVPF